MSQSVEGLVKSGQRHNTLLRWESTTTAGILIATLKESGATPLTQISGGKSALFLFVTLHTNVRKVIRRVSIMPES